MSTIANGTCVVFNTVVEYRLENSAQWAPASLISSIHHVESAHLLQVDVVDVDGETVLFTTTIVESLALQCDAAQLEDGRRVDVYDESNERCVQITFSDREDGKSFLLSLVAGSFRSAGCVAPTVFVVNADAVRRNKGVESADTQAFSLSLLIQRAAIYHPWTLASPGAQGELVLACTNPTDCTGIVIVGGSTGAADANTVQDPVGAAFLAGKEGMLIMVAFDPSHLGGYTWIPEPLRDALHAEGDTICALLVRVDKIEVSEDARKESIKKRLQRQGAHSVSSPLPLAGGKPLRHVSTSNDSFGADRLSEGTRHSTGPRQEEATHAKKPQHADTPATHEAPVVESTSSATKKKSKNKPPLVEDDATAEPTEQMQAKTNVEPALAVGKAKTKSRKAKEEALLDVESPVRREDVASPVGDISSMTDYAQLLEMQVKLDKKKQRLLKFEAELLLTMEQTEQGRLQNESRAAELAKLHADVEAERQVLAHQRDQNDAVVRMMIGEDERARLSNRISGGTSANKRGSAPIPAAGLRGSPALKGGGEREPLIGGGGSSGLSYLQSIQGPEAGFVLRVDHPFYDNSGLPPSVERCYGVTAAFLRALHHPVGTIALLSFLGAGVGLTSWSVVEHASSCRSLWPLAVLFCMAAIVQLVTLRHKTALYDGLHRLDQSCSQLDHVAFIYQRRLLFFVFPLLLVAASLTSIVTLVADVPILTAIGIIVGTMGATLSFGAFSLLLHLVTSVAWDRVCAVIPAESGSLCSRLAIRRVSAHYQFVKTLVAGVSAEWTADIIVMLAFLGATMVYCVYAAIQSHSYTSLLVCNALFTWASAFSFLVLRAVTGWQRATLSTVGVVSLHIDRWARGDYNSEGDLRLEDYVALQQSMYFATQGSSYAKWSLRLFDDGSTMGRLWLWCCGLFTLLSAALIPVTVLYHIDSWDA